MKMKSLGEKIRELREERDLSLRDLGKKLGKSAAFLSDVELGRRHPSDAVLIEIAKALNTKPDELKTFDSRPPVDEIKRLSSQNPKFGLAFRTIVDANFNPDDLLKALEQLSKKKKDS